MTKVLSARALAVILNQDEAANTFLTTVTIHAETGPRAPAEFALYLVNNFDADKLSFYADPGSSEKDLTDGDGATVGKNMRSGFIWDKYEHTSSTTGEKIRGQWYLDHVDGTNAGAAVNAVRDTLTAISKNDKEAITKVMVDGHLKDLKMLPQSEQEKMLSQFNSRRTRIANTIRKSIQVIRMWQRIEEVFGSQYAEDGTLTKLGTVAVGWVYANDQNPDLGLSTGLAPIRIYSLAQQDSADKSIRKGARTGIATDMSVNEFINLSVDEAIQKGGSYVSVVQSEKKKTDKTAAGQGTTDEGEDNKKMLNVSRLDNVFTDLRIFAEDDDSREAFNRHFAKLIKSKPDEAKVFAYNFVECLNWMSGVATKEWLEFHDAFKKAELIRQQAETAAKLANLSQTA